MSRFLVRLCKSMARYAASDSGSDVFTLEQCVHCMHR